MSEYLTRLKQLRDATPAPGNAPNVHSNVSFRRAIDYIERLEAEHMPEELFDGYSVYENLPKKHNNDYRRYVLTQSSIVLPN